MISRQPRGLLAHVGPAFGMAVVAVAAGVPSSGAAGIYPDHRVRATGLLRLSLGAELACAGPGVCSRRVGPRCRAGRWRGASGRRGCSGVKGVGLQGSGTLSAHNPRSNEQPYGHRELYPLHAHILDCRGEINARAGHFFPRPGADRRASTDLRGVLASRVAPTLPAGSGPLQRCSRIARAYSRSPRALSGVDLLDPERISEPGVSPCPGQPCRLAFRAFPAQASRLATPRKSGGDQGRMAEAQATGTGLRRLH
jgi:hypothetical protein